MGLSGSSRTGASSCPTGATEPPDAGRSLAEGPSQRQRLTLPSTLMETSLEAVASVVGQRDRRRKAAQEDRSSPR